MVFSEIPHCVDRAAQTGTWQTETDAPATLRNDDLGRCRNPAPHYTQKRVPLPCRRQRWAKLSVMS